MKLSLRITSEHFDFLRKFRDETIDFLWIRADHQDGPTSAILAVQHPAMAVGPGQSGSVICRQTQAKTNVVMRQRALEARQKPVQAFAGERGDGDGSFRTQVFEQAPA